MNKKTVLLGCLFVCHYAIGNDNVTSVVDSFLNCDNSFFHQLKDNIEDISPYSDLTIKDDIAYIPVSDVSSTNDHEYRFKEPIKYRGLELAGYQNIYINTNLLGKYYYWGFTVNNSIKEIQGRLPQLSWQPFNEMAAVANSRIYDSKNHDKGWQNNPYIFDGVVPRANTIEKSIYLEKIDDNHAMLLCSLQGDIDKNTLYLIHPDMKYIDQELADKRESKIKALQEQQTEHAIPTQKQSDDVKISRD